MRTFLLQIPSLVAAVAGLHVTGLNLPHDQKDLSTIQRPVDCEWIGDAPNCRPNGCPNGFDFVTADRCGNGACCNTGYKIYCCRPTYLSTGIDDHSRDQRYHHTLGGDDSHDDVCPAGEAVYCPPGATNNDECICVGL